MVRLASAVLLLSSEERDEWTRFEPRARYSVVRNPFVSAAEALACGDKRFRSPRHILFVGRLITEKGVLDLIRAFALLPATQDLVLSIAGDGPARAECLRLGVELGVSDRINLVGHLSGPNLWEMYSQASVFVFPSYFPEGFPTVLTEAMAAGSPIVTTGIRGARDVLTNEESALLVPPRSPLSIRDAVLRLLGDEQLAARLAAMAKSRLEDLTPENVVGAYLDVLMAIANRGSGDPVG